MGKDPSSKWLIVWPDKDEHMVRFKGSDGELTGLHSITSRPNYSMWRGLEIQMLSTHGEGY